MKIESTRVLARVLEPGRNDSETGERLSQRIQRLWRPPVQTALAVLGLALLALAVMFLPDVGGW